MPYQPQKLLDTPSNPVAPIWRYLDLAKLLAILNDRALFFPSGRQLSRTDRLEGQPTYVEVGGPVATEPKVRFRPETGLGGEDRRTASDRGCVKTLDLVLFPGVRGDRDEAFCRGPGPWPADTAARMFGRLCRGEQSGSGCRRLY